ncbi:MAG: hypothetical protein ACRD3J_21805, partial [Thermoanaerobaculia bacterium]
MLTAYQRFSCVVVLFVLVSPAAQAQILDATAAKPASVAVGDGVDSVSVFQSAPQQDLPAPVVHTGL